MAGAAGRQHNILCCGHVGLVRAGAVLARRDEDALVDDVHGEHEEPPVRPRAERRHVCELDDEAAPWPLELEVVGELEQVDGNSIRSRRGSEDLLPGPLGSPIP